MSLKKIPLEKWKKFSEDEKRFHELEYKKSFERNKMFTIVSTRVVALLCVGALFFIGFVMLGAVKEYGQIKDQYGPEAFCYLCGLETHKSCECIYTSRIYEFDDHKREEEYFTQIAEENAMKCDPLKVVGSQGQQPDFTNITIKSA